MIEKEYYSTDDVAGMLSLHVRTVRRMIRDGTLNATRIGKQYRITAADLKRVVGEAPAHKTNPRQQQRTRSVLVSATADVEAITREESYQLASLLTELLNTSGGEATGKRIECIYYEELGRLRVMINTDANLASSALSIIAGFDSRMRHR